jgi:hypothetical protein
VNGGGRFKAPLATFLIWPWAYPTINTSVVIRLNAERVAVAAPERLKQLHIERKPLRE